MIRQIKNEISKSWNSPLVLVFLIIYICLIDRSLSLAIYYNMSIWEFVLYSINDHYYLMYGYFFFLVFYITNDFKSYSNLEVIRFGNMHRYHKIKTLSFSLKFTVFIFLHILISFIIGVFNLDFANMFFASDVDELYLFLSNIFANPLLGVTITSLYLLFGSVFIQIIYLKAKITFKNRGFAIFIICTFISMIMGFVSNIDTTILGVFCLNNYLIFHHSYLAKFYNIITIIAIVIFVLLKKARATNKYAKVVLGVPNITLFIAVIALVSLNFIASITISTEPLFFVFVSLRGFSFENVNLIEFLLFLAFLFVPLFAISIKLDNEKDFRNNIGEFRYGSKKLWQSEKLKIHHLLLAKYVIIYFIITLLLAFGLSFFNTDSSIINDLSLFYAIGQENFLKIFASSIALRFLELYFVFLSLIIIYKLLKNVTFAFILTFIGYILVLIFPFIRTVLPLGASSMYQILENQTNLIYGAFPFSVWILALILINKIWRTSL